MNFNYNCGMKVRGRLGLNGIEEMRRNCQQCSGPNNHIYELNFPYERSVINCEGLGIPVIPDFWKKGLGPLIYE
jgi:hypothetical protein